jgi:hypothetical protein
LLFVAILMQTMLLAVMIFGLLPISFLRSLAGHVQKTFAAVLGDSYLFVASPISASAAVTQVKNDLEWLAERCDQVVILAHSQGAAVAYRAIDEWSWEGRVPKKLKQLITYGSGLRKLFELQQLSHDHTPADTRILRMAGVFAVIGSIGIMTFVLWLVGAMPCLPFALSFTAGFVFVMLGLFSADKVFGQVNPALPSKVTWMDLFASHDPVSNGPIEVAETKFAPTGQPYLDQAISLGSKGLVDFFHMRQREVVNLQSSIADHTTYWSATDDFVNRVVTELMRISEIPSPATPDAEWLDLSIQRRRWRVGLRRGCRNVAILAALCSAAWPSEVIRTFGVNVSGAFSRAAAVLPKQWMPDWIPAVAIPPSLQGLGTLLICICGVFAIAMAGWNTWERREIAHFFRREPFRAGGIGLTLFAMGWFGILVVTPAATAFVVGGQARWPSVWTSSVLLVFSCWTLVRSGMGPGRLSGWIPTLLQRGELLLGQKAGDRSENLTRARGYFSWAGKWLLDEKDSMERVRALLGMARVLEEMGETNKDELKGLKEFYMMALASLECMGEDTGAVRERLDKLSSEAASSEATQKHGESPP